MAFTQTDLDKIQSAIATGTLHVAFADRSVTYRSIDELEKAEKRIQAALDTASGTAKTRMVRLYSKT